LESEDKQLGFNAYTMEYVNLIESGVIDPTKVVRTALIDASSIASLMITTESAIVDEEKEGEKGGNPMGGMGGGMPGMGGMGMPGM
jgi:chaperonin GroEL